MIKVVGKELPLLPCVTESDKLLLNVCDVSNIEKHIEFVEIKLSKCQVMENPVLSLVLTTC